MNSVYAKILLWCFAALLVSLQAFSIVTRYVEARAMGRGGPMARFDLLVIQEAIEAYQSGGSGKLAAYLNRVAAITGPQRYLTDSSGKDLVSGEDRSAMLITRPPAFPFPPPWRIGGRLIIAMPSADNRYRLITIADPPLASGA